MRCVPKSPLPGDFCGCPPCPICFDWVSDQPVFAGEEQEIVSGVTKMAQDLLGEKKPTPEQVKQLESAADRIHVANKTRQERIEAELKEADALQHQQRHMIQLRKDRREALKPLEARTPLDHMDLAEIEKTETAKQAVAQEVEKAWNEREQERLRQIAVGRGGVSREQVMAYMKQMSDRQRPQQYNDAYAWGLQNQIQQADDRMSQELVNALYSGLEKTPPQIVQGPRYITDSAVYESGPFERFFSSESPPQLMRDPREILAEQREAQRQRAEADGKERMKINSRNSRSKAKV